MISQLQAVTRIHILACDIPPQAPPSRVPVDSKLDESQPGDTDNGNNDDCDLAHSRNGRPTEASGGSLPPHRGKRHFRIAHFAVSYLTQPSCRLPTSGRTGPTARRNRAGCCHWAQATPDDDHLAGCDGPADHAIATAQKTPSSSNEIAPVALSRPSIRLRVQLCSRVLKNGLRRSV